MCRPRLLLKPYRTSLSLEPSLNSCASLAGRKDGSGGGAGDDNAPPETNAHQRHQGDRRINRNGRPVGSRNRRTLELRDFLNQFFTSDEYRASVKRRILRGQSPHLETHLLAMCHGKPESVWPSNGWRRGRLYSPRPMPRIQNDSQPAFRTRRRGPWKYGSIHPRPSDARRHHRVPSQPTCPRGHLRVACPRSLWGRNACES
jgi:hypothetical protein